MNQWNSKNKVDLSVRMTMQIALTHRRLSDLRSAFNL